VISSRSQAPMSGPCDVVERLDELTELSLTPKRRLERRRWLDLLRNRDLRLLRLNQPGKLAPERRGVSCSSTRSPTWLARGRVTMTAISRSLNARPPRSVSTPASASVRA
jgi:hypothetical protein